MMQRNDFIACMVRYLKHYRGINRAYSTVNLMAAMNNRQKRLRHDGAPCGALNNPPNNTPVKLAKMSDESPCQATQEQQQADGQTKSKNQLKNEAKKAAKLEKFAAKQAKMQEQTAAASEKKATLKKTKEDTQVVIPDVPYGEKKDLNQPMPSAYEPKYVEAGWYGWWHKQGLFKPECQEGEEVFTMILPPPNVTGSLHLGHAMMGAIEDAIARWHRMHGKRVLFLPGCDHAGIATQAVVEKRLKREKSLTKHDIGREAFVKEVWQWKEQYGNRIYEQLKRMGLSLDWDRARFTLDAQSNAAVNEAFCRLYEDGLIFRANRLVNWSGKLKTAISDLEVEMKEIGPKSFFPAFNHPGQKQYPFGVLWSFAYKVEDGEEEIVIPTTRPETLFADVAVAVNPKDSRYTHLHGKKVIHPITGKPIPIICDEAADPEFGTGALKISPGHDPIDFQVGLKHNLPCISVFDENNCLNDLCGDEYKGMPRYEARLKVLEEAQQKGVFRGEKDHPMILPVCSRSGDFLEPRLMPQWWLDCKAMAQASMDAVANGDMKIVPEEQVKVWNNWLGNIRDWCLSRQLWWGHQIPAYQVIGHPEAAWIVARTKEEALAKARAEYGPDAKIEQDPDVLDTWFSSGLWPFSTMGWPNQEAPDLKTFFPNTLLETGSDILFFWVARMVMLSIQLLKKVPFTEVFLHSIVRDAHGRKMSKSLGNVIDPIAVIEGITLDELHASLTASNLDPTEVERAKQGQKMDFPNGIPECGTDALRFALCSYVTNQGRDVNLNVNEVFAYRRFCNKLWQACRFFLNALGDHHVTIDPNTIEGQLDVFDQWILSRLNETVKQVEEGMQSYVMMNCTKALYSFWLNDLCDVYIESIKPVFREGESVACGKKLNVLWKCIHDGLLLLHPFMPFITEELYQRLPSVSKSICISKFPVFDGNKSESNNDLFQDMMNVVKEIRSVAAEQGIAKGSVIALNGADQRFREYEAAMASLVKSVGTFKLDDDDDKANLASAQFSTRLDANQSIQVSFYNKA